MGHRSWFTTIKTKDDIASLDVILREGDGERTGKIDYDAGIYISYFAKVKKSIGPLKKGETVVAWNSDGSSALLCFPPSFANKTKLLDEYVDTLGKIKDEETFNEYFVTYDRDEVKKASLCLRRRHEKLNSMGVLI